MPRSLKILGREGIDVGRNEASEDITEGDDPFAASRAYGATRSQLELPEGHAGSSARGSLSTAITSTSTSTRSEVRAAADLVEQ